MKTKGKTQINYVELKCRGWQGEMTKSHVVGYLNRRLSE